MAKSHGKRAFRVGESKPVKLFKSLSLLAVAAVIAGCADDEVILEGERLAVRAPLYPDAVEPAPEDIPEIDMSFEVAAPVANAAWTHTSGSPTHRIAQPKERTPCKATPTSSKPSTRSSPPS